ncbi:MAG TPA: D-xylose ABC transporter substrate-binding protein [Kofleriaceae bacterium]|nr:D-xylose ABC transporter substrate-binding protein [Kofleriaceae bacterium]
MKMSRVLSALLLVAVLGGYRAAYAQSVVVGVSWSNFQEERWKRDEAAMKAAIEKAGGKYISADAQGSNEKQSSDIENLITRGAKVLIVLAWDADAVLPAVKKARAEGIPVIAYDRLIQDKDVFYITFDNVEVGRMQARGVFAKKPSGNYVFIKGSPTDPNADFLRKGQEEVVGGAIKAGKIKVVGEQYTEGWSPEVAQRNMEQILTKNNNKVDAVVASNDGTAGGVVAALRAQNMVGIPVSGQDGDIAALNRVARGEQTVSVWKDARKLGESAGTVAVQLGKGKKAKDISGTTTFAGGTKKIAQTSMLLKPVPITSDNLDVVVKANWVTKAQLCRGVSGAKAPAACK